MTLDWNEPVAASIIGENVETEHLMYILEIEPPIELDDSNDPEVMHSTLMPACTLDGDCVFNKLSKTVDEKGNVKLSESLNNALADLDDVGEDPERGEARRESLKSSMDSTASSGDMERKLAIVNGVHPPKVSTQQGSRAPPLVKIAELKKKISERSLVDDQAKRNFQKTFYGLKNDTEYKISVSFVLSGKRLGTESFTILSHEDSSRKSSAQSNSSGFRSLNEEEHPAKLDEAGEASSVDKALKVWSDIIDGEDLKAKISEADKDLTLVRFEASWCDNCIQSKPKLEVRCMK